MELGNYNSLMAEMQNLIQQRIPHNFINHEHEFKTILDGILTALSDMKLFGNRNINVIIVPEFQVGSGRRVDLAIQTVEPTQEGYHNGALILMELSIIKPEQTLIDYLLLIHQIVSYQNKYFCN